jgi:hypothetical protein
MHTLLGWDWRQRGCSCFRCLTRYGNISENCVSVQVRIPGVSRNFLHRKSITHQLSNHVPQLVSLEIRRTFRCSMLSALKIPRSQIWAAVHFYQKCPNIVHMIHILTQGNFSKVLHKKLKKNCATKLCVINTREKDIKFNVFYGNLTTLQAPLLLNL